MERAEPGPLTDAQAFRVWVRRQLAADGAFSVKFEVSDGKGLLRVVRPGVLIDPPARQAAQEDGLSGGQLRASGFLVAREPGRSRLAHQFSRLEDSILERLDLDRWVELQAVSDGESRLLVLPIDLVGVAAMDDEPTSPQSILADLRDDLSGSHSRLREATDEYTPVRPTGEPPDAELADWAATFAVREHVPVAPTVVEAVEDIEVAEDPDDPPEAALLVLPEPIAPALAAEPATEADPSPLHHRRTTLVRFFRRKQMRDGLRIAELEATVRAIKARSGEAPS